MPGYNTYARTIISDNPAIVRHIEKYAGKTFPPKKEQQTRTGLLDIAKFERALLDPHAQYILSVIATLPRIIVVQKEYEDLLDKIVLERTLLEKAALDLDEKIKYTPDVDQANLFLSIYRRVNEEYRKLLDLHIDILVAKESVTALTEKGAVLLNQNEAQWVSFRENLLKQLIEELESNQFPLVDTEKQAVLRQENWAELIDDLETLNIDLPKRIDTEKPSFEAYYAIKDILAKHASLGRRMLPNTYKDIDRISTPKKFLKNANKSAEKLVKEQTTAAKALTSEVDSIEKKAQSFNIQLDNQHESDKAFLSQAYKPTEFTALEELASHSMSDWRAFSSKAGV